VQAMQLAGTCLACTCLACECQLQLIWLHSEARQPWAEQQLAGLLTLLNAVIWTQRHIKSCISKQCLSTSGITLGTPADLMLFYALLPSCPLH